MWSLEQLEREIDNVRARIAAHRRDLAQFFVRRNDEIELLTLCAAAQEPLLLVGPPGTAKSDLVVKWVESVGLREHSYFEYMLTKFTEPSEILGPIDIDQLKQGRFIRRTRGKLPEAEVVFLDEVFKSNSAILNTLLTVLNERKYYQDGEPVPVKLQVLFAATNEIPDQSELDAMADRFILKIEVKPVKDTHFAELIAAGMRNEAFKATGQRPWMRNTVTLQDYQKLKRFMDLLFAREGTLDATSTSTSEVAAMSPRIFAELRRVVRTLESEDKVLLSDRKLVKLYKLIRTRAFLMHGGAVDVPDLALLGYAGNRRHELPAVQQKVKTLLGLQELAAR